MNTRVHATKFPSRTLQISGSLLRFLLNPVFFSPCYRQLWYWILCFSFLWIYIFITIEIYSIIFHLLIPHIFVSFCSLLFPPLLFYFWYVSTSIDISLFILNLHIIFTLTFIYLYILWGWIPRLLLIWSFLYMFPWAHVQDSLLRCLLRSGIA